MVARRSRRGRATANRCRRLSPPPRACARTRNRPPERVRVRTRPRLRRPTTHARHVKNTGAEPGQLGNVSTPQGATDLTPEPLSPTRGLGEPEIPLPPSRPGEAASWRVDRRPPGPLTDAGLLAVARADAASWPVDRTGLQGVLPKPSCALTVNTVDEAIHPSHAPLWIRTPPPHAGSRQKSSQNNTVVHCDLPRHRASGP